MARGVKTPRKSTHGRLWEDFLERCRVIAQAWDKPVADVIEHFSVKGGINREYRKAVNKTRETGEPVA